MPDQLDQFVSEKPKLHPMIYAYSENNPNYEGLLKIGFTASDVARH